MGLRRELTDGAPMSAVVQVMKTSISEFSEADQNVESLQVSVVKSVEDSNLPSLDMQNTVEQYITGLALILAQWVENTSASAGKSRSRSRNLNGFYSPRAPSINIKQYLERIQRFFVCSDECFVLVLVYISRVAKREPLMTICDLSVHRVVFLAMMLATKVHDDKSYSNGYYAKVGGLPVKEVNALEQKFIHMLDWKLNVQPNEYQLYHSFVCQAANRGISIEELRHSEPEPEP
jgi:hypothetical protein